MLFNIISEAVNGNYSFFILVVGLIQLWVMCRKEKK